MPLGCGSRFLLHLGGKLCCSVWTREGKSLLVWKRPFYQKHLASLHAPVNPARRGTPLPSPAQDPCRRGQAHTLKQTPNPWEFLLRNSEVPLSYIAAEQGSGDCSFEFKVSFGAAESKGLACSCKFRQWQGGICVLMSLSLRCGGSRMCASSFCSWLPLPDWWHGLERVIWELFQWENGRGQAP